MNKLVMLGAAVAMAVAGSASAQSLNGQTIFLNIQDGSSDYGTASVIAGSGNEGNFFGNQFFMANGDTFQIRSSDLFCGFSCGGQTVTFSLSGLDFGTPITGIDLSTLLTGVTSSFTNNTATFSFTDQRLPPTTYLTARFLTGQGVVPEPATWLMLILGFGAIGIALRSRPRVEFSYS